MNTPTRSNLFPDTGSYLLFDDDCGVCTTFSHFIARLLRDRVELIPMHIPQVEQKGTDAIGEEYWSSFHMVTDGRWTTDGDAIIALATTFPYGSILGRVASFPLIHRFLVFFLNRMKKVRSSECEVDFSN